MSLHQERDPDRRMLAGLNVARSYLCLRKPLMAGAGNHLLSDIKNPGGSYQPGFWRSS